ncbi:OmpA family protein [Salegentibacter sp. F188]|uniref:OmpA family protein n=1 Tax=Autumnicola patrickiae TaxID=3075591 RepID=A0ABU3DY74_9FLAO|nr:OmpA family protein [Salegentibacter sp. F188]MDT0688676.1 OmpA family protein [Salegentibacter sp. F188]
MKNIYKTILLTLISISAFGQKSEIKKADKLFVQRAYVDAASAYEDVSDKNQEVLQNLGDSYFYTNQMQNAAEVYRLLFLRHEENVAPEYEFRYAHSLRATGENDEADEYFASYYDRDIAFEDFQESIIDSTNLFLYETEQLATGNTASSDFGISYFGDDKITFASTRNTERPIYPWNKKPALDLYSGDISDEGEITNVVLFSDAINTDEHESSAIFSQDGQTVYFDRTNEKRVKDTSGVKVGHISIYRSEMVDGAWSEPVKLPFSSEEYSVEHPALSPDGSTLFFASDMPGGQGSFDLYKVAINEDGTYGNPENLGPGINTEHREQFPFVSENNTLYFASDGHLGFGNLDVYKSEGDYTEAENLGESLNSAYDDFAFIIKEGEKKGFLASNRSGNDNIYSFERTRYVKKTVEIQIPHEDRIYFEFDKSNITPEYQEVLDQIIDILKSSEATEIQIASHADARGTDEYNMDLSQRRAESTKNYLVEHGIAASDISTRGYGESQPVNDCTEPTGCTEAEYAQNRRSVITFSTMEEVVEEETE